VPVGGAPSPARENSDCHGQDYTTATPGAEKESAPA
jgi:hypothetical protein